MAKKTIKFKPELDKNHNYAIGVRTDDGSFTPFKSYSTEKELSKAYDGWYRLALQSKFTLPIAVEKLEKSVEWENSKCMTLPEIMQRAIDKNQIGRN